MALTMYRGSLAILTCVQGPSAAPGNKVHAWVRLAGGFDRDRCPVAEMRYGDWLSAGRQWYIADHAGLVPVPLLRNGRAAAHLIVIHEILLTLLSDRRPMRSPDCLTMISFLIPS
jgi:hypothetical protein